jgi:hypothetical protein
MDHNEYDDLECEANGKTPHHLAAQLALAKKERLIRVVDLEAVREVVDWSQIEP